MPAEGSFYVSWEREIAACVPARPSIPMRCFSGQKTSAIAAPRTLMKVVPLFHRAAPVVRPGYGHSCHDRSERHEQFCQVRGVFWR